MNLNRIARIGSLVGEPARTAMLVELVDGRALTASELARAANVSPQTASRHLALLVEAGLLSVNANGRRRYHRLASPEVARLLESIMQIAAARADPQRARVITGPRDAALRAARTCYDHLAGRLGVAIADRLLGDGSVAFDGEAGHLTDRADRSLAALGLAREPVDGLKGQAPRPTCRPCLDWSERRSHIAGRLGALVCAHCLDQKWLLRRADSRALNISPPGQVALRDWLGLDLWRRVAA